MHGELGENLKLTRNGNKQLAFSPTTSLNTLLSFERPLLSRLWEQTMRTLCSWAVLLPVFSFSAFAADTVTTEQPLTNVEPVQVEKNSTTEPTPVEKTATAESEPVGETATAESKPVDETATAESKPVDETATAEPEPLDETATAVKDTKTPQEQTDGELLEIDFEAMTVTANRFEQPVSAVLAPVNIIARKQIEQSQFKSLPEALSTLPGVEVAQNGGRGQNASIFVRGSNSTHVLVLVDGFRMVKSTTGSVDFNQIPLAQVERIEYIRGAKASVYGSEAISGVINIITKGDMGINKNYFEVSNGSQSYGNTQASSQFNLGGTAQLKIAGGYEETEGYNVRPMEGVNDGDNHGFASKNAMLAYEQLIGNSWSTYLAARWYENEHQYDSSYVINEPVHQYKEGQLDNRSIDGQVEYFSSIYKSSISYSYSEQQNKDYLESDGPSGAPTDITISQQNAAWQNHFEIIEATIFGLGIDWREEQMDDEAKSYGASHGAAGEIRDNIGVFAIALYQDAGTTLELSARSDDNSQYGQNHTWNAAAGYEFISQYQIIASAGTAFKAPDFSQLYYPSGGNPDLNAEESENVELAVKAKSGPVDWRVTAYQNKIENMIDWDSGLRSYLQFAEAEFTGLEFEFGLETGPVTQNLSFEFRDPTDGEGNQLVRRAKRLGKWQLLTEFEQWDMTLDLTYQGQRPDIGDEMLESYTKVDVAARYWVVEGIAINGKVNNVFNREYETAKGYPSPGSLVYLGTQVNF